MVREVTPPRDALCLRCRTALAPGEPCDAGKHHPVVRLGDPAERRKALDEVWGPPHLRAKQTATAGATGGGAGALFEGCGACGELGGGGEIAGAIAVILIAAIAAVAVWWIARRILHAIRNHRARLRPRGADKLSVPRTSVAGTVIGGEAWGVELTHDDAVGSKVTLRDGGAAGLQLRLDDGQIVVVPDGRARVEGDGERVEGNPIARGVDPEFREVDDHPVIAFDRAHRVDVRAGDRVVLLGELETRPDPRAHGGDYREAPPTILVPAGVPRLRKA